MSHPTLHKNNGALAGIRIIEFAVFAAGPVVGKLMAEHGAEVIR
ncbi:MAG: CoA transferase, partial [Chloroflexi bacterium]